MTAVHHIEHTLVALVQQHSPLTPATMTIGMVGCMGMVSITTREGIEALYLACEAALRATEPKP